MDKDSRQEPSDAQAVARVLGGDTEAFAVLVRRHQDYLFGLLARRLPPDEVAEAAQDAFMTAYEKLSQLRQPESFRAWLTSLALRRAVRYWREVAARRETPLGQDGQEWLENYLAEESGRRHEDQVRQREARSVAHWLLGMVKPEDRVALGLFYSGEHDQQEIAAMLGWSLEKVKVRLHRARALMAKAMRKAGVQGGEL